MLNISATMLSVWGSLTVLAGSVWKQNVRPELAGIVEFDMENLGSFQMISTQWLWISVCVRARMCMWPRM